MATNPPPNGSDGNAPPLREPVWHFRGYNLRSSEFNTAMIHFYRGESESAGKGFIPLDDDDD